MQYDVELYQRIEQLIGKQLPLYKTEEDEVMVLQERVAEAQRLAKLVMLRRNRFCSSLLNFVAGFERFDGKEGEAKEGRC